MIVCLPFTLSVCMCNAGGEKAQESLSGVLINTVTSATTLEVIQSTELSLTSQSIPMSKDKEKGHRSQCMTRPRREDLEG